MSKLTAYVYLMRGMRQFRRAEGKIKQDNRCLKTKRHNKIREIIKKIILLVKLSLIPFLTFEQPTGKHA